MPWIDNVVPYTTILSTWGNNIRDHAPAIFASVAERDTNASKMPEGQMCVCVAEKSLYVRRPSAASGFSTVSEPWKNYTIQYQLDPAFPVNINQFIGRWRRVGGTTVQALCKFNIGANYASGVYQLIWSLPVRCEHLDMAIGSGDAWDNSKYVVGAFKTTQSDAIWCGIVDPTARAMWKPQTGTPSVYCTLSYEVADG